MLILDQDKIVDPNKKIELEDVGKKEIRKFKIDIDPKEIDEMTKDLTDCLNGKSEYATYTIVESPPIDLLKAIEEIIKILENERKEESSIFRMIGPWKSLGMFPIGML